MKTDILWTVNEREHEERWYRASSVHIAKKHAMEEAFGCAGSAISAKIIVGEYVKYFFDFTTAQKKWIQVYPS